VENVIYVFLLIVLCAVIYGPYLWARWVLSQHGKTRSDLPGTGGELARYLLDEAGIGNVTVEKVSAGDHYDPTDRAVRLEGRHLDGRSISAVAVAAHEVGHALQHRDEDPALLRRHRLIETTAKLDRAGSAILFLAPVVGLLSHHPAPIFLVAAIGIGVMAIRVVVNLVTLPVELDASFNRALPILMAGNFLARPDLKAARRVLTACALTYVAGSLASLLNFYRWIRFFR
jgi:Zn-dependent membrane protease YugP